MNKSFKGSLLLILCAIVWGMAFSAQSRAMAHVQPYTFVLLRSCITCAALFAVHPLLRRLSGAAESVPMKKHLAPGVAMGVFLAAATVLQQVGLVTTTPAKSGFVTALYIVMVPLLGVFLGRRLRLSVVVGVALSLCGLYLLCVKENLTMASGDLLTLLSALMFSFQILLVDRYSLGLDAVLLSAVQFAACAVLSGVLAFTLEQPSWSGIRACWLDIAYVGLFSGAVGYTLQIVGQKYTEPTLASLLMCLESVFAALGGWLLLGQVLTGRELAGCLLMLCASIVAQLPARAPRKA